MIGGFVVEAKGWRWTQWVVLFFTASFLPSVFLMKETYKKTLMARGVRSQRIKTQRPFVNTAHELITKTLTRPLHMLFTEPIIGLLSLYVGFNFALTYSFFVAFQYVFSTVYRFDLGSVGLTFLGLGIGCILACFAIIWHSEYIYKPKVILWKQKQTHMASTEETRSRKASETTLRNDDDQHGQQKLVPCHERRSLQPEERLWLAIPGTMLLPVSLFLFAWTARPSIHWIVPVIAEVFFGIGNLLIYMATNLYIVDVYGAGYGASALSANSLLRYLFAAVFPLFSLQMYERLGVDWAVSLLGFISIFLAGIPWCFIKWGPGLRARSRYSLASVHKNEG